MNAKWLALFAFLAWEAWWVYEMLAAPRPDEEMRSVFAFLMAVVIPIVIVVPLGLAMFVWRWMRHKPVEKPE